jgi:hypothetical protein
MTLTYELALPLIKTALTKIVLKPLIMFESMINLCRIALMFRFILEIKDFVLQVYGLLIDYSSSNNFYPPRETYPPKSFYPPKSSLLGRTPGGSNLGTPERGDGVTEP